VKKNGQAGISTEFSSIISCKHGRQYYWQRNGWRLVKEYTTNHLTYVLDKAEIG